MQSLHSWGYLCYNIYFFFGWIMKYLLAMINMLQVLLAFLINFPIERFQGRNIHRAGGIWPLHFLEKSRKKSSEHITDHLKISTYRLWSHSQRCYSHSGILGSAARSSFLLRRSRKVNHIVRTALEVTKQPYSWRTSLSVNIWVYDHEGILLIHPVNVNLNIYLSHLNSRCF